MKNYTEQEAISESLKYFDGDELAATTWVNKYAMRDESGVLLESSPSQMISRVINELVRIENKFNNPLLDSKLLHSLMDGFKYIILGGSPMSGIGNPYKHTSLSNCFVTEPPLDSYGGIFKTDQELVQLMKRRGGNGTDLSNLRPATAEVTNDAKTSSGLVSFMERFSNSTKEVAQAGRRGALMLTVSVKHPDAEQFIDAKLQQGKVTGANISVKLTDDFMSAVKHNQHYYQVFPITEDLWDLVDFVDDPSDCTALNGKHLELNKLYKGKKPGTYVRKIKARKLWEKIIYNAWKSAEPGVLFWDTIIKESPADFYEGFETVSTNPCLSGDTKVLMADRSLKCIKDIIPGDRVISVNLDTNEEVESTVTWSGLTRSNVEVMSVNGLEGTFDHKLANPFNNDYHNLCNSKFVRTNKPYYFDPLDDIKSTAPTGLLELISDSNQLIKICNQLGCTEEIARDFWGKNKGHKVRLYRIYRNWLMFNDKGLLNKYDEFIEAKFKEGYGRKSIARLLGISYTQLNWYCDIRELINISQDPTKISEIRSRYQFNKNSRSKLFNQLLNELGIEVKCNLPSSGITNIIKYKNKWYYSKSYAELKVLYYYLSNGFEVAQEVYSNDGHLVDFLIDGKLIEVKDSYSLYSPRDNRDPWDLPSDIELVDADELNVTLPFSYDEISMYMILDFDTNQYYNVEKSIITNSGKHTDVYDISLDSIHNFYANGILVHNCGEIPLCPYDSCRLMSINLVNFVSNPFTNKAFIDFDKLGEVAYYSQRIMDNLIELELEHIDDIINKINSDPEPDYIKSVELNLWNKIKLKTKAGRRTGIGITAEGDMLAALGVIYGSQKSIEICTEVHKTIALGCYQSSIYLAMDRGSFEAYNKSEIEFDNPLEKSRSQFISRIYNELNDDYRSKWKEFGRRNISCLTIAPAGTVSIMTRTTSGIEPLFKAWYIRRRKTNDKTKAVFTDSTGEMFEEFKVFHPTFIKYILTSDPNYDFKSYKDVVKYLNECSEPELNEIYEKSPWYKSTAQDINWVDKVSLQGAVQKWVDHSISCTVNVPNDTSVEIVDKIYTKAYESGCKGCTIYRDGSRDGILVTKSSEPVKSGLNIPRPDELPARIVRFKNGSENWIAFIGMINDRPYEIFCGKVDDDIRYLPKSITSGKIIRVATGDAVEGKIPHRYDFQYEIMYGYKNTLPGISAVFKSEYWNYARFISGMLRAGLPIIQVINIINSLNSDMGDTINTWKKGVARALKQFVADGEKSGAKCTNCGAELVFQGGCQICPSCGNSKCE